MILFLPVNDFLNLNFEIQNGGFLTNYFPIIYVSISVDAI